MDTSTTPRLSPTQTLEQGEAFRTLEGTINSALSEFSEMLAPWILGGKGVAELQSEINETGITPQGAIPKRIGGFDLSYRDALGIVELNLRRPGEKIQFYTANAAEGGKIFSIERALTDPDVKITIGNSATFIGDSRIQAPFFTISNPESTYHFYVDPKTGMLAASHIIPGAAEGGDFICEIIYDPATYKVVDTQYFNHGHYRFDIGEGNLSVYQGGKDSKGETPLWSTDTSLARYTADLEGVIADFRRSLEIGLEED